MDEPGFYTELGTLPFGDSICDLFRERCGYDLRDRLAWLVLDSPDNAHVAVRNDYYSLLNRIIAGAVSQLQTIALEAARAHGRATTIQSGIHATWHGEFCGLEEMSHGSLDLWTIRPHQSAAFTDASAAERLMLPEDAPDIIYSLVLARSLSRMSPNKNLIYANLWGYKYGTPDSDAPVEIIDYWRDLLDLFGARWIAHAYGYTGTLLMDPGFGPGFPDHPAWERFKILNERSDEESAQFESGESIGDVLIAFPVESFYAIGHMGANRLGRQLVRLVDTLTRKGWQVDIVGSSQLSSGSIESGQIILNDCAYNSLIVPYGNIMPEAALKFINRARDAKIPVITDLLVYDPSLPYRNILFEPRNERESELMEKMFARIKEAIPPTFDLPSGALANVRRDEDVYRVYLIADRPFGRYGGTFRYSEVEIEIEERTEPLQVLLELAD
jgi:hypothetical protein